MKHYISLPSALALLISAAVLPFLGALPAQLMTPIGERSAAFFGQEAVHHAIAYFSAENLIGAAESIGIGAAVYLLVVRPLLMRKENGVRVYADRWPAWLDLENLIYRPVLNMITWMVTGIVRCVGEIPERIILLMRGTAFSKVHARRAVPVGNRFTYGLGLAMNGLAQALNATVLKRRPMRTDFEYVLDASWREFASGTRRITASISFGLLLLCIGLFVTCLYLLQ